MAYHLLNAKPLLGQYSLIINWTLENKVQWNLKQNILSKCIKNCRRQNVDLTMSKDYMWPLASRVATGPRRLATELHKHHVERIRETNHNRKNINRGPDSE